MNRLKPTFAVVLVALLTGCAAPAPTAEREAPMERTSFVIALPPGLKPEVAEKEGELMEDRLEAYLRAAGSPYVVQVVVPESNAAAIAGLRDHAYDAAMLSAWPAAVAAKQADASIALAEVRQVYIEDRVIETTFYYSHYIVRKDSPYTDLEDVRGKDVAYPSRSSTSGYVFPVAQLVAEHLLPMSYAGAVDPGAYFGEVVFAGSYGDAWKALQNGTVDVAVVAGDIKPALYEEIRSQTKVIATQGPVPSHTVVMPRTLAAHERAMLEHAFLSLSADRDLVRALGSATFVAYTETTTAEHASALAAALTQTGLTLDGLK